MDKDIVEIAVKLASLKREPHWSKSIAVGDEPFITEIQKKLGTRALGRKARSLKEGFELREDKIPYISNFDSQNNDIAHKNTFFWEVV